MKCACGNKVKTIKNGVIICCKCNKKNRKVPLSVCNECGKNSRSGHRKSGQPICHKCYLKTYNTPIEKCSICKLEKNIFSRNPMILCRKCYMIDYVAPKKVCIRCNKIVAVHKNTENGSICKKCYKKAYKPPEKTCKKCYKKKVLATKDLCCSCRNKERLLTDANFAIRTRIRKRVSKNIRAGRMSKSLTSLINYKKIIAHLGSPPSLDNYHIDHIFPLIAFDLTKESHVLAAFAPENHQWLLDTDNLCKKDFYNKKMFNNYIEEFLKKNIF